MSHTTGADTVSGWAYAVRQRRGAMMQRIAVGMASSLAATSLVGWPTAVAWGLAYIAIQAWEAFVFAPLNRPIPRPMSRARNILGGATMFANTGLYGALSIILWALGGAAGGVSAAIMLSAAMVYSMVNAPRSLTVLACTTAPQILYMAAFPFLLMGLGAPLGAAITAAAAVIIFTIYCLNVWRGLADRLKREQHDRLQAEAHVERMSRELSEQRAFLAAIGHDLRTPIGAILSGAAEVRGADAGSRQNAELITDAGLMMKSLLDDLLDHSRIGAGRMAIEVKDFDLRQMLAQTLQLWRAAGRGQGAEAADRGGGDHAPVGQGRRDPHSPGAEQPAVQRHEVHRQRDHHPAGAGLAGRADVLCPDVRDRRHRAWHDARPVGPTVHPVRSDRRGCHRPLWRIGPGTGDQPQSGGADGRAADGAQHAGPGVRGSPSRWSCRAARRSSRSPRRSMKAAWRSPAP